MDELDECVEWVCWDDGGWEQEPYLSEGEVVGFVFLPIVFGPPTDLRRSPGGTLTAGHFEARIFADLWRTPGGTLTDP